MLGRGIIATFPKLSITANTPRRSVIARPRVLAENPDLPEAQCGDTLPGLVSQAMANMFLLAIPEVLISRSLAGISWCHHRGQPAMVIALSSDISFLHVPGVYIEVE